MPEASFHFARPEWLWALLLLLPVMLWLVFTVTRPRKGPVDLYADAALLPHLTGVRELDVNERWSRFFRWAILWLLAVLAMAGPRWDFREIEAFTPGSDLVVLLDISRSMEVADVRPTRLGRARQEIQDLVQMNRQLRIGLVAFASVAHVVAPITEDGQSILNALPALSTDLARLQGSRLHAALERAELLLRGQPEDSGRNILLISDGDFDEPALLDKVRLLAGQGIRLHVLGIGNTTGAPVPAPGRQGDLMRDSKGQVIRSSLNVDLLRDLATAGGGLYRRADFRDADTRAILAEAASGGPQAKASEDISRVWNERFHWLLIILLLALLPTFRRTVVLEPGS